MYQYLCKSDCLGLFFPASSSSNHNFLTSHNTSVTIHYDKIQRSNKAIMMATASMNTPTSTEATPTMPSTNTRRISFVPIVQVFLVLARNDFTQEEKESYWCSNRDQQVFRVSAMELVVETRKNGHGFIAMVDESYQMAQRLSSSLKPHQIDTVLRDPQRYTEQLEAFTLIGQGRRGLEKFTSNYHRQARRPVVLATKAMVCDMSRMGIGYEEIAELYAEQSRTSLIYSRMVGCADCRAAYWIEQVERGVMSF
jgi:hypothetical protein